MYDDCLLQIGNKYRGEDEYHNTIYCNKLNNESDEKCSKSSEFRFDNCNNVIWQNSLKTQYLSNYEMIRYLVNFKYHNDKATLLVDINNNLIN